jgi:hypothetical protein
MYYQCFYSSQVKARTNNLSCILRLGLTRKPITLLVMGYSGGVRDAKGVGMAGHVLGSTAVPVAGPHRKCDQDGIQKEDTLRIEKAPVRNFSLGS